jgi:hypothetical protein
LFDLLIEQSHGGSAESFEPSSSTAEPTAIPSSARVARMERWNHGGSPSSSETSGYDDSTKNVSGHILNEVNPEIFDEDDDEAEMDQEDPVITSECSPSTELARDTIPNESIPSSELELPEQHVVSG